MQAIQTKYHGPTDHKAARVSARCDDGRLTIPWDHSLNADENHAAAARELARKLGWLDRYTMVSGGLLDGTQCHVLVRTVWVYRADRGL